MVILMHIVRIELEGSQNCMNHDYENPRGKSNTSFIAPVMNGSGGDLVGIQASRMTTYLHKVIWIINTMNFTSMMIIQMMRTGAP